MKLLFTLWLVLALGVCVAQTSNSAKTKTRPNLSGTWSLDNSKSKPMENVAHYVLTIVHQEPEIRMTRKYKQAGRDHTVEVTYYTDGRPELSSQRGHRDPEPITRWQKNKLVRRTRSTPTGVGVQTFPPLEIVTTEVWELSPDTKTLTRTITNSGMVTSKFRYIFNRIP